ncbi:MAG: PilZ domain-containing protein [Pseudomonadota bacterium]
MHSPISMQVKFKSLSLEQFAAQYGADLDEEGIFIRTPRPLQVGTGVQFNLQLQNGSPVFSGDGTVVWVLPEEADEQGGPIGMGMRFDNLSAKSKGVLSEVIDLKGKATPGNVPPESASPSAITPLKVRLKSNSIEQFAEQYGAELTQRDILIRTSNPLPVGTHVNFDLQLLSGDSLFGGKGTVVWSMKADSQSSNVSGMALRFDHLPQQSNAILMRALALKAGLSGKAGKIPSFADDLGSSSNQNELLGEDFPGFESEAMTPPLQPAMARRQPIAQPSSFPVTGWIFVAMAVLAIAAVAIYFLKYL